jgi:hypothetical protein
MSSDKIKKMQEKRDQLNKRIRQQLGRETSRNRKRDTRRKILAGAAVLYEAQNNPAYRNNLYDLLNRFLEKTQDRELFGLPPLPDAPIEAPKNLATKPATAEKEGSE